MEDALLSNGLEHPDDGLMMPSGENQISEMPIFEVPDVREDAAAAIPDAIPIPSLSSRGVVPELDEGQPSTAVLRRARRQITTPWKEGVFGLDEIGFVDCDGYIMEVSDGHAESVGEATYYTAVTIVALATDFHRPEDWELANTNATIEGFLACLLDKSWGNEDVNGQKHPIRHPKLCQYDADGNYVRQTPLNRDSFAQIVAACYYSFHCPRTTDEIRTTCRDIIAKWIGYLEMHKNSTHPNQRPDEFDKDDDDKLTHLFANTTRGPITYVGPETYVLAPHELASLRSCALSMGLEQESAKISAWIHFAVAVDEFVTDGIADWLAGIAAKWLREILNVFRGTLSVDQELIPGFPRSKLKIKVDLGLDERTVGAMVGVFQKAVRESCRYALYNPEAVYFSTGADDILEDAIDKFIDLFPDRLYVLPLPSVMKTLLEQAMPWLRAQSLADAATFLLALAAAESVDQFKDSSFAGYFFWNWAVELDARPELTPVVADRLDGYFTYINGLENPNGLWAWLVGKDDVVRAQLAAFEGTESGWTQYAYASTNYDVWLTDKLATSATEGGKSFSPRIDYLALRGFCERGRPQPLHGSISTKILRDVIAAWLDEAAAEARDRFRQVGEAVEEFWDLGGRFVRETIKANRTVERAIFAAGVQTSLVVYHAEGQIISQTWRLGETLATLARYAATPLDGIPVVGDLVELHLAALDSSYRIWVLSGRTLLEFHKYASLAADGVLVGRAIAQIRDAEGRLEQWVWASVDGSLASHGVWKTSSDIGQAVVEDCTTILVRDIGGQMGRWNYEAGRELAAFAKWAGSSLDGAAAFEDCVQVSLPCCRSNPSSAPATVRLTMTP